MAANMPMMATTIIISINVKPCCCFDKVVGLFWVDITTSSPAQHHN